MHEIADDPCTTRLIEPKAVVDLLVAAWQEVVVALSSRIRPNDL